MKKLLIVMLVIIIGCSSQQANEEKEGPMVNDTPMTQAAAPLNSVNKWKADEATKKNVAALAAVVNDTTYRDVKNRKKLYTNMQAGIDTLINECRMKGPEHEALHGWLEKVMMDVKAIEKKDDGYSEAYAALKKDVEHFYDLFE